MAFLLTSHFIVSQILLLLFKMLNNILIHLILGLFLSLLFKLNFVQTWRGNSNMIDFKRNCTYFFLLSKPLLYHVSSLSLFLPAIKEWSDLRNHKAVSFSCFYTVSDFQSGRSVIWLLKNCLRFQSTYKFIAFLFVFNPFFLCFGHLLTIWFNVLVFIPHNQKIKSELKKWMK